MDLQVRSWLPSVDASDAGQIGALLADDETWTMDNQRLDALRDYLFEPNYGTASQKAADLLRRLLAEQRTKNQKILPVAAG